MKGFSWVGRVTLSRVAINEYGSRAVTTQAIKSPKPTKPAASNYVVKGPVAKQLHQTGIWTRSGGRKKSDKARVVDNRRVNIVSQGLCDDIVKYVGPSLERHRGCDLVDLNPGAGVWSRTLHKLLEPRRHIMMDLDAEVYTPLLADLISKANVELIHKSGLVWRDLFEMIRTKLSSQSVPPADSEATRNDTLLITANLSMFPKRPYSGFDSVSTMVLYQLMTSIRHGTLFQRYGLVRMLIWVNDEDKRRILPQSINRRKRSAFEAELSCEWLHEVAGHQSELEDRIALRDEWINLESGYNVLARMQQMGLKMPPGRETSMYKRTTSDPSLIGERLAGVRPPSLARPFKQELDGMERGSQRNLPVDVVKRLKMLRHRTKIEQGDSQQYLELLQEREHISRLAVEQPDQLPTATEQFNERLDNVKKNTRNEFAILRDSYHLFRQSPPVLLWDRRAYEPLAVSPTDFFPNSPSALLDIQPKPVHNLLREHGPTTSRAGDISDAMLRSWFQNTTISAPKAMEGIWSGFGDLSASCPSFTDTSRGGSPMATGYGALSARSINEEQWIEILQAWMDWPFRPSYTKMLGRVTEDGDHDIDDDDGRSGASTADF